MFVRYQSSTYVLLYIREHNGESIFTQISESDLGLALTTQ